MNYLNAQQFEALKPYEAELEKLHSGRYVPIAELAWMAKVDYIYEDIHNQYNATKRQTRCSSCSARNYKADAKRLAAWYFTYKQSI